MGNLLIKPATDLCDPTKYAVSAVCKWKYATSLLWAQFTLLRMANTFPQRCCETNVVTPALATDDFKQQPTPRPLALTAELRRMTSPNPPTRFPYISPAHGLPQRCGQRIPQWLACDVLFNFQGDIILWIMWLFRVAVRPLIKVSNQLVAAPVGSNVDIGCDVEASPKAMNSWFRDTGKVIYRTPSSYGTANPCPLFVSTDSYSRIRLWPDSLGWGSLTSGQRKHRDVVETL